MNETLETIFKRRAVRKYLPQKLEAEQIEYLIEAARMAPSAMNSQPWHFYILTNEKLISGFSAQIAELAVKAIKHTDKNEQSRFSLSSYHLTSMVHLLHAEDHIFYHAPLVILVTTNNDDEWGAIDAGMVCQNLMLAAKSLGLDSCPIGLAKFIKQTKDFYLLNIPASEEVQLAIVVGYGNDQPTMHERVIDNVRYFT